MDLQRRYGELLSQHGPKHWTFAAKKDIDFVTEVERVTAHLSDLSFTEKVYCALNGFDPRCEEGNRKKLISMAKGWSFCGPAGKCACAKKVISQKARENVDHAARLAKTHATLERRYGTRNATSLPQAKEGRDRFLADPERVAANLQKGKVTLQERYGTDNALKLVTARQRRAVAQKHIPDTVIAILEDRHLFEQEITGKSSILAAKNLGINVTTLRNYIRLHKIERELSSSFEDEIAHFLRINGITFRARDRTIIYPKELDFYIDDFKLGIEFNGLYWHSCQVIEDNTHELKWKMCENANIRLLMINEDEWTNRPEVLQNKILNLCGVSEKGVGARKLSVRKISNSDGLAFVDHHHIQGKPSMCLAAYGAFLENVMVGVVTLFRQRSTGHLELTRFCSDGKIYAGMFSKILKVIKQDFPEPIVTFADLRYSDGNLYERCGFIREKILRPDYRYVKRNETFHKSLFTKKRIHEKFGIDMSGKTEREAMSELGFSRIYDCGKIRYRLP